MHTFNNKIDRKTSFYYKKKQKQKNSQQDGHQMVEVKFNSCKIIPNYYNIFTLHMHTFTIFALILSTLNIAIR
jgi:hypothetical protein